MCPGEKHWDVSFCFPKLSLFEQVLEDGCLLKLKNEQSICVIVS